MNLVPEAPPGSGVPEVPYGMSVATVEVLETAVLTRFDTLGAPDVS